MHEHGLIIRKDEDLFYLRLQNGYPTGSADMIEGVDAELDKAVGSNDVVMVRQTVAPGSPFTLFEIMDVATLKVSLEEDMTIDEHDEFPMIVHSIIERMWDCYKTSFGYTLH